MRRWRRFTDIAGGRCARATESQPRRMATKRRFLGYISSATMLLAALWITSARSAETAQSYASSVGGTLITEGQTEIDGHRMSCGTAPTVLNTHFNDFGGSMPGFLILNPNLFVGLATPVKQWIYSHECAHQAVGSNEVKADCVAVQRGKREGWLTEQSLRQVCDFMKPSRADSSHFSGPQRCRLMQRCFNGTRKSS
jgi:hypothetical protein